MSGSLYRDELVVVPIPNGTYEVVNGRTETMMKCVIRPVAAKTARTPKASRARPKKVGSARAKKR